MLAGPAALTFVAAVSMAGETDSPYCRRVRALADSRAALLYAPRFELQGGRFPETAGVVSSARESNEYQVRAALSLSLIDVYKGRYVERVGESECAQHATGRLLEDLILQAADFGRLPALRKTAHYLEAQRGRWREIERHADAALAARVASLPEAQELRDRCATLERRRTDVGGEIARLEAVRPAEAPEVDLGALILAADEAAMQYEREASHLRSLDAWELRLTGGAVPDDSSSDLFGIAHLSFNFGVLAQRAAEQRVLEAREEELRRSRSELRERLRMFQAVVAGNANHATQASHLLAERLASLRAVRSRLAAAQASKAPFARDVLELELIAAEAELVFLEAWRVELHRVGGTSHAG
jgi:hypothetical protein